MGLMVSAGTLAVGLIIGYLGQRSGFCTIGGIRNFYLTRDTHLLKGVAAIVVVAAAGFLLTHLIGGPAQDFPAFSGKSSSNTDALYKACTNPFGSQEHNSNDLLSIVILTILGGVGLGLFSVIADGCPFRQHIRASEGDRGSFAYIMGFYIAAIVFGFLVKPIIMAVSGI